MDFTFSAVDDESEDMQPPSYRDPGTILVQSFGEAGPYDDGSKSVYRFDVEVLNYDGSACLIAEGEGFIFWLENVDELTTPGIYVIEDIKGAYHRGDGWTTDDDVKWEWGTVRPATITEIIQTFFGVRTDDAEISDIADE